MQQFDADSTLNLYRTLLAERAERALGAGELEWLELGADLVAFRNGNITVVSNLGESAIPLPEGELVLASAPVEDGSLPADTTVWLA